MPMQRALLVTTIALLTCEMALANERLGLVVRRLGDACVGHALLNQQMMVGLANIGRKLVWTSRISPLS